MMVNVIRGSHAKFFSKAIVSNISLEISLIWQHLKRNKTSQFLDSFIQYVLGWPKSLLNFAYQNFLATWYKCLYWVYDLSFYSFVLYDAGNRLLKSIKNHRESSAHVYYTNFFLYICVIITTYFYRNYQLIIKRTIIITWKSVYLFPAM